MDKAKFETLKAANPPLKLVQPKRKGLVLFGGSMAFVLTGLWLVYIGQNDAKIWGGIAFFGLGAALSLLMISPKMTALHIDKEGFTVSHLGIKRRYLWRNTKDFSSSLTGSSNNQNISDMNDSMLLKQMNFTQNLSSVPLSGMPKMVYFNDSSKPVSKLAAKNGVLPYQYGMNANQLAELMTHWQKRFGQ